MNDDLRKYIQQARKDGTDHETITDRLVSAGWSQAAVAEALDKHRADRESRLKAAVPVPTAKQQSPIPVVQTLSTRGVEYYLMLIAMAVSALSLGMVSHGIAADLLTDNASAAFSGGMVSFSSAALLVSLPLFIFFFLRLKKAELANPDLRLDPSRRRGIQLTLISTFLIGLLSAAAYIFTLLNASYGGLDNGNSVGLTIADLFITLLLGGGIFAYFWIDSHPRGER